MKKQKRFEAIRDVCGAFTVRDNQAHRFNMNPKAVTLFMNEESAKTIADILNSEWYSFLKNPT